MKSVSLKDDLCCSFSFSSCSRTDSFAVLVAASCEVISSAAGAVWEGVEDLEVSVVGERTMLRACSSFLDSISICICFPFSVNAGPSYVRMISSANCISSLCVSSWACVRLVALIRRARCFNFILVCSKRMLTTLA